MKKKTIVEVVDWPSYRLKAAYNISINISKWFRGFKTREYVKQLIWYRFNKSAIVIQRYYRSWRIRYQYILFRSKLKRLRPFQSYRIKKHDTKLSYNNIIKGDCSIHDKIAIWQLAIDLRKGHGSNTDNCIKAIVQSQGDKARSITLLGIPAFAIRYFDELPLDLKELFSPNLLIDQADLNELQVNKNTLNPTVGFHGLRALSKKNVSHQSTGYKNVNDDLYRSFINAVETSYFSKVYAGSKITPPKSAKLPKNNANIIINT